MLNEEAERKYQNAIKNNNETNYSYLYYNPKEYEKYKKFIKNLNLKNLNDLILLNENEKNDIKNLYETLQNKIIMKKLLCIINSIIINRALFRNLNNNYKYCSIDLEKFIDMKHINNYKFDIILLFGLENIENNNNNKNINKKICNLLKGIISFSIQIERIVNYYLKIILKNNTNNNNKEFINNILHQILGEIVILLKTKIENNKIDNINNFINYINKNNKNIIIEINNKINDFFKLSNQNNQQNESQTNQKKQKNQQNKSETFIDSKIIEEIYREYKKRYLLVYYGKNNININKNINIIDIFNKLLELQLDENESYYNLVKINNKLDEMNKNNKDKMLINSYKLYYKDKLKNKILNEQEFLKNKNF
jgi:hypothetical protein